MNPFKRTRLRHSIPSWVEDGAVYFVTISAIRRHINQLATPSVARAIKEAMQVYKNAQKWNPILVIVMPDHLHLLASLNTKKFSITQIISPWKCYIRKSQQVEWQECFFEHRIRDLASLEEKKQYMRMNPVRAGLVNHANDWHYIWTESSFQAASNPD